ncbi:MAG: PAS domain S-box protein [Proteobacteria bacterium]|nr:PAS domain S-box protein [Pseudomonadota bacterium]MBU1582812.1 PAS domain S-box protein [Pseudomonadota bacterium]MBU2627648.1 PAS domain S-box protein [Pseudomonadota bacterium]
MKSHNKSIQQLTRELAEWKTECQKAQKALQTYKDKYFLATNAVPDPIVFYDMEGKVTYLNPAFTQVFGWDLKDLLNKKIDFIPQKHIPETQKSIERLLNGEKIISLETKRYTKDKKILDIQLSTSAYQDDHGTPMGSIVIYRDVTQKKIIENMLLESEERYRSAMEATADPIIVYDKIGRVLYFNPAFSRVFKWSLSERIFKKMDDFVPKENWPETKMMIDMVVAGKFFSGIETARFDKEGNIIPVSISGSTYRDKDDKVIGSVINLQDISERKQAQETIKQKEKLKGVIEMAGAVCHELSQPAMIIAGYTEIFLMNIEKENPLYEKVDKIKEQVHRIGSLTKKLMNITKYETREYSEGKKIVDIDKASQRH